jgi:Flp pilus assembly pilin Flp
MFERISLKLEELLAGLKSDDGQGVTEYGAVIGLLLVILGLGLGLLSGAIETFLGEVATALGDL